LQVDVDATGKPQRHDPSKDNTTSFEYVQQVAVKTDENTHSGMDVAIHAMGPMAHLFHRVHEQSYVAHVIGYAARIGRFRDTTVANAILDVLGFT
jgi:alkaline phosphatase